MAPRTKLEDKLKGIENFRAWKYRIGLILRENDLNKYIKKEVVELEEDEVEEKHKKDLIRPMRIIVDSIKYHLIPQVSSKETPKEMYDSLSRMHKGRNINIKMNFRAQLKSTEMSKGEYIQDYFTRISQFKEQLETLGDSLDEDELAMTALNGITRPWDSFIHTMCAKKESMKFDIVWEDLSKRRLEYPIEKLYLKNMIKP